MRQMLFASFLAVATLTASAPLALASHDTPPGDALEPLVDVAGAIFHDPLGMCHWSGCPWPWSVENNFVGGCDAASGADWWLMTCNGVWQELYFDVQVAGGGFTLSRLGTGVNGIGLGDSVGLSASQGVVAVFCGPPDPSGPECVTNVDVSSALAEIWRDTS